MCNTDCISAGVFLPLGVTIYLLTCTIIDWRTMRIPNWLTLPPMALLAVWRLARLQPAFLAWWVAIYVLWLAHVWGGGDAKVLMVMSALWPNMSFLLVESLAVIALGLPLLIRKYRGRSPLDLARQAHARLVVGAALPTEEQLDAQGPGTFLIAAGGIAYAWLAWMGKV